MANFLTPWHLVILVLVVVVLFGAKRLPDAARSIGRSMKIFKAETKDMRGSGESGESPAQATGPDAPQLSAAPQPDKDQQIAELQRQLDELKNQQTASASNDQAHRDIS